MARVAVFGGTGFAGRNVCDRLRAAGHDVTGLSRTSGCDLLDLTSTWRAIDPIRPDIIVNCAAYVGSVNFVSDFGAEVFDINMRMLLNIYKMAQQMRESIVVNPIANCAFPGVMETYRESGFWDGPIHSSVLGYGATRRMMEVLSHCYHEQFGVRSINLFVPNMYGPFDSTNPNKTHALNALVIKFLKAQRAGAAEVEVWGTGKPIREWLYVKDFARIIERVIANPDPLSPTVSIAQNTGHSVDEIVAAIRKLVGYEGAIRKNTGFPDGAPKKVMDDTLFRQRYPDFEFTPLETGLDETIAYYAQLL